MKKQLSLIQLSLAIVVLCLTGNSFANAEIRSEKAEKVIVEKVTIAEKIAPKQNPLIAKIKNTANNWAKAVQSKLPNKRVVLLGSLATAVGLLTDHLYGIKLAQKSSKFVLNKFVGKKANEAEITQEKKQK